jgi:competence protein ComEC
MESQLDLRQYPFVRVCLFYIIGIFIANVFLLEYSTVIWISLLSFFTGIVLLRITSKNGSQKSYQGIFIGLIIFLLGFISYQQSATITSLPTAGCEYGGIVANPVIRKEKSLQVDCKLYRIGGHESHTSLTEKVRLYLSPDSAGCYPEIGDSIRFAGRLARIKNAGNPGEFDYARYLSREKIYYSGYIKTGEYKIGGYSGKYWLRRIANKVQSLSVKKLETYGFKGDELAVISALTAGKRDLLDNEIISEYAVTGALHVLSVSGLHVGILYMLLSLLFGNRNQFLYFRLIRLIIIFTVIWFYAFITGLSSPVLRACVMFSLFLLGKSFNRYTNGYNILAASAFLILIINPQELFKVGFQFSYLAVLGILYFQPKLEKLSEFRYSLIDRIWQLITVSMAAQLATLPLSLFYFHQFPTYFLLTNLIVIPVTWVIMMLSVLFYISLPVGFLAVSVAFILNMLLKILNYSITYISQLPFATLANIRFEPFHLVIWTILLVLITIYINYFRKIMLLYLIGGMLIILVSIDMLNYSAISDEREIILYSMRKNTAVSLIEGHRQIFLTEGLTEEDWKEKSKYLKPFWISRQVNRNMVWIPLEKNNKKELSANNIEFKPVRFGYEISFYNEPMLYLKQAAFVNNLKNPVKSDHYNILLVNGESGYPRKEYLNLKPTSVIICQRLYQKQKKSWEQYAEENNLSFHDVNENGAFILRIK